MSTSYPSNDHTPIGMSTSLRRNGSVTRSRSGMTPSVSSNKRGSAFLNVSSMEFGSISPKPDGVGDLMNETAGLKKVIEGLNKTNGCLRGRITDLERLIEHNTGPEVERLNKELATLEDLFAKSQKDNEAHYAESERQKAYVKELENLLTTSLGMAWQESHNIYPPAPTTAIVTSSTPLPPPKPTHPLRHSVSFSNKRSSSKLHSRASSVLDLGLMSLQAVREDERGMEVDDTPTGALRKLSGSTSTKNREKEKQNEDEEKHMQKDDYILAHTPQPKLSASVNSNQTLKTSSSARLQDTNLPPDHPTAHVQPSHSSVSSDPRDPALLSGVDVNQLNQVLQLLSNLDPSKTMKSLLPNDHPRLETAKSHPPSAVLSNSNERNDHLGTMRRMLENQQKLLKDRETRLNAVIQMAKEKEERYAMTT
ncbi:hypothetical protein I302_101667 [Kwoniella bestiolae CBS 10118]|uniref:Uncharacterized protein n=1 Tax=Kwoniella bestiolae CBS 10118 TaxID=1296100 RepID=A0A1B9GCW1_9TREE|nr:hypothetical protein I302_00344 [Kwoniella bestiolae CBS 10118]OCF28854.1 hypothetical protein I302_00344 [Kwoniella bestiolae CBS 10118]